MATWIAIDDECKLRFQELKAKSHRFIIYKIDEEKRMAVVEQVGEPALNYNDFLASLPENECRHAIFDYESKIFFISWHPDVAHVKSKMMYSKYRPTIRLELDGVQMELQASESAEIGLDVIQSHAN